MIFELIEDTTKLTLIVACLYFALGAYVRRKQPAWSEPLDKRRLAVLLVLVLAVTAIKVSEDVLGGESGPIDEAILVFIRGHVPSTLIGFFEAITVTGSSRVLVPLATAATIALLCGKRRFEALLLAASVISGATVVYIVKTVVGRVRPALWETEWYWGCQLSQRPYSGCRGIRHRCCPLRRSDLARGARARAVDSTLMDHSHWRFTFGDWRALANGRIGRCVHRSISATGNERCT